jgi:uncharacterized protein
MVASGMGLITSEHDMERILGATRRIAVLGANPDPSRAAHYVPQYLSEHGYDLYGVNVRHVGERLWGHEVVARLGDLEEEVEIVLVFRRPADIPPHVDEILALSPRPATVWFQLGIRHDVAAERLAAEGIDVVQDRCIMTVHKRRSLDDAVSL